MLQVTGTPIQGKQILIMGDYVDRGKNSIETLCLLLAFKIRYPNLMHLLRGNHECERITRLYGFYDEVKRRYGIPLWRKFTTMFEYLPAVALIDERIICMHGGLSPELVERGLGLINSRVKRPCGIPDTGMLCDILWSDPTDSG